MSTCHVMSYSIVSPHRRRSRDTHNKYIVQFYIGVDTCVLLIDRIRLGRTPYLRVGNLRRRQHSTKRILATGNVESGTQWLYSYISRAVRYYSKYACTTYSRLQVTSVSAFAKTLTTQRVAGLLSTAWALDIV